MKIAYPRWLHPHQTLDKSKRLVQSASEEQTFTGVKMNPDGTPFVEEGPKPPTMEEITAAGYKGDAAQRIIDEEKFKFENQCKPYGPNEPPEFQYPVAVPVVEPPVAVPAEDPTAATPEVAAVLDAATSKVEVDHAAVGEALGL